MISVKGWSDDLAERLISDKEILYYLKLWSRDIKQYSKTISDCSDPIFASLKVMLRRKWLLLNANGKL